MKTMHGQPITASRTFTSKKRPFVPDAKETSANEETMIKEAPAPFKNNMQTAQMPVGTGPKGAVPGSEQKPYANLQHKTVGARALPQRGPIGQRKPINQSGQVNGRMGTSFPSKVGGADLKSKYPSKRNASFYGE